MENLPFLSQSAEPSLRSVPPQQQPEPEPRNPRAWTPQQDFDDPPPPRRFVPAFDPPRQQNVFDSLKDNQVALILIGIVIGVLIMNMRPIIVNPMK
jgi:hypothetical protein